MKHLRHVTIPKMAVEYKAETYKQDTILGPIIAGGKLVALVGGTIFGAISLFSGFSSEL